MSSMESVFAAYSRRAESLNTNTNPLGSALAWIEGDIVPLLQARIPILDQGFLHGDLTYDVPSVWHGRIFRFDDHLERLESSCKKLRLTPPLCREDIKSTVYKMVAKSGLQDACV